MTRNSAPGMAPAIVSLIAGGVPGSALPAITRVLARTSGRRAVMSRARMAAAQPVNPATGVAAICAPTRAMTSGRAARKGSVNQRASVPSTSAAQPPARAIRMRSSHNGPASGGMRLLELAITSRSTRSGAVSARCWPIMPPIETPTQWLRAMSRASNRPSTSATRSSKP